MAQDETTSMMDDLLGSPEDGDGETPVADRRRHTLVLGIGVAIFVTCVVVAVLAIRASASGGTEGTPVPWRDAVVDGTSVTVTWDASPCAQVGTTSVVETDGVVEVTVREVPRQAFCSSPGEVRTETVTLEEPVGDRQLVDGSVDG